MTEPKKHRVIIRLKHSMAEGEEIHAVLPDDLARLEAELAQAGIESRVDPDQADQS